jgi:HAD superfamily hydrolase (TIGR01509 family)
VEPPSAVIFDLDGTLVDSLELYYRDLREILLRVGLPPVPKEEVLEVMRAGSSPWDVFIPKDMPNRKEFVDRCIAIDREIWPTLYHEEARLFPGSRPTIESLFRRGIKLGIVTSGWEEDNEISHLLSKEGVAPYINALIMKPDTKRTKPAPDPILLCLERISANPASAVYVGDAPDDIRAGKAAGTRTAAVLSGVGTPAMLELLNPDWIIKGVDEVPGIFFPAEEEHYAPQ